jgi:hypothetical protein
MTSRREPGEPTLLRPGHRRVTSRTSHTTTQAGCPRSFPRAPRHRDRPAAIPGHGGHGSRRGITDHGHARALARARPFAHGGTLRCPRAIQANDDHLRSVRRELKSPDDVRERVQRLARENPRWATGASRASSLASATGSARAPSGGSWPPPGSGPRRAGHHRRGGSSSLDRPPASSRATSCTPTPASTGVSTSCS